MEERQSSGGDTDGADQVLNRSIVIASQLIAAADGFEKKDQSWFATSQIPTDLSVQVEDITFHVHKYPLVARCGYLSRIELQPPNPNLGYDLKLDNFPGGSETFEVVLKFCYGLPIGLNPKNVAALRCASEFLEMSEALDDGNLISKTEAFLTFVVLSSWRDSITVLKSCEKLSPWAENLQIVRRCCDSIAWKVSRENLNTGDNIREENLREENWWFQDVATLRIDHFIRIVTAIRIKGVEPEIIGSCITQYAEKWLPSIHIEKQGRGRQGWGTNELHWNITRGWRQEGPIRPTKEYRMIIESLVSILPPQKEAVSCKFLLWMLRMATFYSTSPALVSELEKRAGMVLENANVNDLLIPNCTVGDQGNPINLTGEQTMHNIDVVQRILEYFLICEQKQQPKSGILNVGKLLDNYLAEIASDPNLSISKFKVLAESLPESARTCDDGLYRAIDTYLKNHPSLSEQERIRLCKIMNCDKLSLDACTHAAQNDRLPLRTVIQVKMRAAIKGNEQTANDENLDWERSWSSTKQEVNTLRAELEVVKARMAELQKEYFELQQEYDKLSKRQRNSSNWTFGWVKMKKPALLQGKEVGEDTIERQLRKNSDRKSRFDRRTSIS